ncbi:MAG: hypothetical protein HFJ01_04340 [Lachnospiraceae bacterium]|jgi:hypothetical protein|nr:hypothetical protein [Lachnospiraceae bacterium]
MQKLLQDVEGSIPAEDIDGDAHYWGISPEQFIDTYLEKEEYGMNYQTRHKPCDILQEGGNWLAVTTYIAVFPSFSSIHFCKTRKSNSSAPNFYNGTGFLYSKK